MDLSPRQAEEYIIGSDGQAVRNWIAQEIVRGSDVADLGCGPGLDAKRYAADKYMGIDASEALLTVARKRNPNHTFRLLDVTSAEPDFISNFTMFKSVLEHMDSEEAVLKALEFARKATATAIIVAWHTPPCDVEESVMRRVPGHFGFAVNQNTYRRSIFRDFPRTEHNVGVFKVWVCPRS